MSMVNHPAHYGGGDNPYEVIKVLEAWGLDKDAYLFNVVKYIARAGKKPDQPVVQDLKKAIWYLERKINSLEENEKGESKDFSSDTIDRSKPYPNGSVFKIEKESCGFVKGEYFKITAGYGFALNHKRIYFGSFHSPHRYSNKMWVGDGNYMLHEDAIIRGAAVYYDFESE